MRTALEQFIALHHKFFYQRKPSSAILQKLQASLHSIYHERQVRSHNDPDASKESRMQRKIGPVNASDLR